jgi:hypothetical protein
MPGSRCSKDDAQRALHTEASPRADETPKYRHIGPKSGCLRAPMVSSPGAPLRLRLWARPGTLTDTL